MQQVSELSVIEPPVLKLPKGLSREEVRRELHNRGIQPVGIHGEDIERLKAEFQHEFENAKRDYARAIEAREQKLRDDEAKLRRDQEAIRDEKEERKLVKTFPALRLFLELAGKSKTGPEGCFSGGPPLARAIARRLPTCASLVALDLSNGTLGDAGCSALARALQCSTTKLQRLDLNSNGIGPDGVQSLGSAISVNASLVSLSLEDNDLTNNYQEYGGVAALSSALTANSTLTALNLNRTTLGVNGLAALVHALKENDALVVLDVDFNGNVKPAHMVELHAKIEENKVLSTERQVARQAELLALRRQQKFERDRAECERKEKDEHAQAEERAKQRQAERLRKYEEEREAKKKYLEDAHVRALARQAEFDEQELSKKKKGKKK